MKKIIIFTNETGTNPVAVEISCEGKNNPVAQFKKACKEAMKNDMRIMNYELPEEYQKAFGLTMKRVSASYMPSQELRDQNAKFRLCTCNQCSAYEEGHCFKYGGFVDGFANSTDCDCIHGTCGKTLKYDGFTVIEHPFETKMSPKQTVKYLLTTDDPELALLKEEIQDFLDDYDEDITQKNKWTFGTDY